MRKLFTIEILIFMLILYIKKGESLKCFVCRSDTDKNCGSNVDQKYSEECTEGSNSEVYCRKISQILKFKDQSDPILIRECATMKGIAPCYKFSWKAIAKQQTCECDSENCNRGKNNIPSILTIIIVFSLVWIFNFIKNDHT